MAVKERSGFAKGRFFRIFFDREAAAFMKKTLLEDTARLAMLHAGAVKEEDFAAMVVFAGDLSRVAGAQTAFTARSPFFTRDDTPLAGLTVEAALQNAKSRNGRRIAVPATFNRDDG